MTKSRTQSYRSELSTSIVGGLLMLMHQSLLAKNLVSSSISTRFTASLTRSANAAGASRYVHGWGVVGLVCRRAGRAAGSILILGSRGTNPHEIGPQTLCLSKSWFWKIEYCPPRSTKEKNGRGLFCIDGLILSITVSHRCLERKHTRRRLCFLVGIHICLGHAFEKLY